MPVDLIRLDVLWAVWSSLHLTFFRGLILTRVPCSVSSNVHQKKGRLFWSSSTPSMPSLLSVTTYRRWSPDTSWRQTGALILPSHIFKPEVSHFMVNLHRFFLFYFFPFFFFLEIHDGGRGNISRTGFRSTWGIVSFSPSVSTLDAAIIIVFYIEKNVCTYSLLEENCFTFLECVRTPWQGWNINRI